MYKDFRDFLGKLENVNELKRITKEVDPIFEISAYIRKTSDVKGPAFLFENVKGFEGWGFSGGLYATRKRMTLALECDNEAQLMWKYRDGILHPIEPKVISDGECKEVILKGDNIDLRKIPIAQHNEKDAGQYIISAVEISKDPETGARLVGIHRLQVRATNRLAFWGPAERRIGRAFLKAEDKKKPLEIAIVLGNDPTLDLASQASVPHTVDKVAIAGGLRKSPLELVQCETVDLQVPRHAEIVMEGRILPDSREKEGPFGEYTGCYSGTTNSPSIEITAITMRHDRIMHTVNTGVPPSENTNMTLPTAMESLYRAASTACPEVRNVNMSGLFTALISIKKRHEGEPYNIMATIFGLHNYAKFCYIFDEDIDIFDPRDVEWAVQTRMQPHKNIHIFPIMVGAPLDPSATIRRHTSKVGYDCTISLSSDKSAFEKTRVPGIEKVSW